MGCEVRGHDSQRWFCLNLDTDRRFKSNNNTNIFILCGRLYNHFIVLRIRQIPAMQEHITIRRIERPRMCVADTHESSPFVWRSWWKSFSGLRWTISLGEARTLLWLTVVLIVSRLLDMFNIGSCKVVYWKPKRTKSSWPVGKSSKTSSKMS